MIRINKKPILSLFIALFSGLACMALDSQFVISGADNWKDFIRLENIVKKPGKWGYLDLVLRDAEYETNDSTDLLLHFNSPGYEDSTGNYTVSAKKAIVSPKEYMFGNLSAVFQSNENTIRIKSAKKTALFTGGEVWDDFSIEFWLSPQYLSDNEVILSWDGAMSRGESTIEQHMRCSVQKRKLRWEFGNFFISQNNVKAMLVLPGIKELVPRAWHHHMVRFDSGNGLLEYLIDGIPEAIAHTTETGRESSLVGKPFAGNLLPLSIEIGGQFTGFIDELRIMKSFVEKPILKKYDNIRGSAFTKIFDLKGAGSLSRRMNVTHSTPSSSFVSYFIRSSDNAFSDENSSDIPWTEVDPASGFDPEPRGRFVQLSIRLYPDGTKTVTPKVSRIVLVAETRLPPPAPIGLIATPENGAVSLRWKRVNYEGIKGYRIFYGEEPGKYDGAGSGSGASPVDAGSTTEFRIEGLSNGTLYYFAIVAYDSEEFPNVSNFSNEVNARPLGLYKPK